MVVVWLAACTPPDHGPRRHRGDDDDTTTDTTDSEPTGDTAPTGVTGVTGDTGPELDCSELPPVPFAYDTLNGFSTSEDFDFDGDGYLCSINSGNLACKDRSGGVKIVAVDVASSTAGTRVLPNGDWVVANVGAGSIVRIDAATGSKTTIATGLQYPNGVDVDADNMVYVAENSGARVRQIDAYTGEQWIVANGLSQPNGVILSPDGNTMYVGSFGGGLIYAIDRLGPTEWDEERVLYNPPPGDGGFDGINVDICGNVYITEYIKGRIYRITPDGMTRDMVVDFQESWIPNMRWGTNIGGWESDILYVTAWDKILALHTGIEGKPHLLGVPAEP